MANKKENALRTRDHEREKQSCGEVFRLAWKWVGPIPAYVHFIEYDRVQLIE
jgi:hypothetical protein